MSWKRGILFVAGALLIAAALVPASDGAVGILAFIVGAFLIAGALLPLVNGESAGEIAWRVERQTTRIEKKIDDLFDKVDKLKDKVNGSVKEGEK